MRVDNIEDQKEQAIKLTETGCEKWVSEKIGGKLNRSTWDGLLEKLREADELIVTTIYNLPLTALQAIEFFSWAKRKNIKFISIREPYIHLDTISLLYSLHKQTRSQRTTGILEPGRLRSGRKKGISQKAKIQAQAAAHLYKNSKMSIKEIMEEVGIKSKSTFYERLVYAGVKYQKRKKSAN